MSRLSMDLKVMPRSQKGHHYILYAIDEVTNYLVTAPIHQAKSEEIGDALIENVISKFGIPEYIIMDQDSAFMSTLMKHLFKRLGIKIKTVGPYNHQSLQAEHGIKSLSTILQNISWVKDKTGINFCVWLISRTTHLILQICAIILHLNSYLGDNLKSY